MKTPARLPAWPVLLAAFAAFTPLALAQVSYVRDITVDPAHWLLPLTKAPLDSSDPLHAPGTPDTQWIHTSFAGYYRFDPADGIASAHTLYPLDLRLTTDSLVVSVGEGTSSPGMFFLGFRNTLYEISFATGSALLTASVSTPFGLATSLAAANRTDLTLLADGAFSSLDPATGMTTEQFTLTGGTAEREFSTDTRYHTYGPNGLAYLLDYGNNRMQLLDPANGFAFVDEFALEAGVITANMPFAIGATGHVYLGDGEGGGSVYTADGAYLSAFALPGSYVEDPSVAPHLITDASGGVYVFDHTGIHQYQDLSVAAIPEPSTYAAIAGLVMFTVVAAHRRRL